MATQMSSTARKIHNLLSSGAVTVTGPNQPRTMKPKVGANAVNSVHMNVINTVRCYVCDEALSSHQVQHHLLETQTAHTTTKFPHKLGQLVGDAFMVIVSGDDVICARCTNLVNYLDRLENDVERVRTTIMGLLNKKYGLSDEGGGGGGAAAAGTPPVKMQKLNSGVANRTPDDMQNDTSNRIRKILPQQANDSGTTITTKQAPSVGVVQQMKITTQPTTAGGAAQQQTTTATGTGTQTLIRKITKIYKCLSCDYKTSDMRLFNTHYETCKQQNFQCKNCKKIYANFGQMKQHMVREHNTPMENTCAVCHINLVNDASLRKHMEAQHATSVVVTSTTTIPASSLANPEQTVDQLNAAANANLVANANVTATPAQMNTSLYACNQCLFKSSDKAIFDEHFRKHLGKPKPFKCRLCSQRFETREAATAHLKQHQQQQGTAFKCGTCSLTFSKRELLSKHIELQHPQDANANNAQMQQLQQNQITVQTPPNKQQQQHLQQQQQLQPQQQQQQSMLTTQKLLQDTINEALSENIGTPTTPTTVTVAAAAAAAGTGATVVTTTSEPDAANNIRFYSCQICSLTFLNENYYNQHMETHRRDTSGGKKDQLGGGVKLLTHPSTGGGTTIRKINTSKLNSTATALLSDGVLTTGGGGGSMSSTGGVSTKANDISATLAHTTKTTMTTPSGLTITTTQAANNVGGGGGGSGVGVSTSSSSNNNNSIPDVDIESIFEKMHSDKGDSHHQTVVAGANGGGSGVGTNAVTNNSTSGGGLLGGSVGGGNGGLTTSGENVVISSQDSSVGGITFNISIPQTSSSDQGGDKKTPSQGSGGSGRPSAGIDMPMLDQLDEDGNKYKTNANDGGNNATGGDNATPSSAGGPVSMPSLDDDNDAAVMQAIQEQQQQQQQQSDGDGDSTTAELLQQIKMDAAAAEHMKDDEGAGGAANQQQQQQQHEQNEAGGDNETTMNEQQQQEHHQQQQQEQQQQQQNNIDDVNAGSGGNEQQQQQQGSDGNENATPEQGGNQVSSGATAVQTADGQVAIELDEAMQAQVDSGQIKFILNENGQILQLDNHILTDSEGNQILVQDPEQIQQLLQSVGVLQSGDGMDSDTLQVMTDANGQMVLVQGENNETQLIDASLLNADGQLVIQQGQDGELGEGAHVIGEDGTRIPVSVSYTADGQPIVQVQHQVLEQSGGEGNDGGGQQLVLEQQSGGKEDGGDNDGGQMQTDEDGVPQASDGGANVVTTSVTTTSATATTAGGGGFFSLADIMQQQQQQEQEQQEQEQQQQQQQQQQSSETKAAAE